MTVAPTGATTGVIGARTAARASSDSARPPASRAGRSEISDCDGAALVDDALADATKKSVAHIDGTNAKALRAGLAEAQAGMSG
ncbi:MAG: hypothetical protein QOH43_4513 [Solirubrobacteraceae bacterium]|jgi:hypothetical protein|nr:hypothetical protein [Solirubrobacteraceae bacterium]